MTSTNRRYKHFSKKTLVFLEIEKNLLLLFATNYITKYQHIRQMSDFKTSKVGGPVVKVQVISGLKLDCGLNPSKGVFFFRQDC